MNINTIRINGIDIPVTDKTIKESIDTIKTGIDNLSSVLSKLGGIELVLDEETGRIIGYKTAGSADTVFYFNGLDDPNMIDLQLVPINYDEGNGELGNPTKFATYAMGAGYGDNTENMFKCLAFGSNNRPSTSINSQNLETDYVIFYYPMPWQFVRFEWIGYSGYAYGLTELRLFEASDDGETWIDLLDHTSFKAGAGSTNAGYIKYNGKEYHKYWKFAARNTEHNATNIQPSLIGLYRPTAEWLAERTGV